MKDTDCVIRVGVFCVFWAHSWSVLWIVWFYTAIIGGRATEIKLLSNARASKFQQMPIPHWADLRMVIVINMMHVPKFTLSRFRLSQAERGGGFQVSRVLF
jgi:hypothetical protein